MVASLHDLGRQVGIANWNFCPCEALPVACTYIACGGFATRGQRGGAAGSGAGLDSHLVLVQGASFLRAEILFFFAGAVNVGCLGKKRTNYHQLHALRCRMPLPARCCQLEGFLDAGCALPAKRCQLEVALRVRPCLSHVLAFGRLAQDVKAELRREKQHRQRHQ